MLEIKLSDFSLNSSVSSNYSKSNNIKRSTFVYAEFLLWAKLNYDLNDPNNYCLSSYDPIKSWLTETKQMSLYGIKMIDFVKETTGILIKQETSLTGLNLFVKQTNALLNTGKYSYSIIDMYKTCLLLEKSGIINEELSSVLKVLKNKCKNTIITKEDTQTFIKGLKKVA